MKHLKRFLKANFMGFFSIEEYYVKTVLEDILGLDLSVSETDDFIQLVSGEKIVFGSIPLAHRYGGHQSGIWADQLGDGRAHLPGIHMNRRGEKWELQLKGSGKTPYSRNGDGRAVLRSSVREFLCSEAVHYLRIPTSRAASLVVSDDDVWRDQFYNGNVVKDRGAVVLCIAKSWFRIGLLGILAHNGELDLLSNMNDSDSKRRKRMTTVNPRYVLKNWMAESAVQKAEMNEFSEVRLLQQVLQRPFQKHSAAEKAGFSSPAPSWAKDLRVSCSSPFRESKLGNGSIIERNID